MKNRTSKVSLFGLLIVTLTLAGCILSGTFVVDYMFSFSTATGFYHYMVDVTTTETWEEHQEDIQRIDVVGFEMWLTNNMANEMTFNVYLDDADQPTYDNYEDVDDNATQVLDNLVLAAGPGTATHVTYGMSLSQIKNVEYIKDVAEAGRFHYYGVAEGGAYTNFTVDSVRVIITFTAGS
ncbi:MAG: hypothetical protein KKA42_09195 [candidate division Zixibacteria bacterium]|nr:hypothetical protein [candidate division Zixibacteria bacterium]